MKTNSIVITVLFGGAVLTAKSQCMMGMGSQHQHGKSDSTHEARHGTTEAPLRGYAYINEAGNQEANVLIKEGYHPKTLVVKRGIPLTINFDLQEDKCTGSLVMKDFRIDRKLVPFRVTPVNLTPDTVGSFTFTCPMNMFEGTIVVKE